MFEKQGVTITDIKTLHKALFLYIIYHVHDFVPLKLTTSRTLVNSAYNTQINTEVTDLLVQNPQGGV